MLKRTCILLVMTVFVWGCSDKPSESEIKGQVIDNIMKNVGDEVLTIENFEKVNGFEQDEKTYIADVRFDLVFNKGLKDIEQQLRQEAEGSTFGAMQANLGVMALRMQHGEFKAGHRATQEQKIPFIKTENGWRIKTY